MADELPTQWHRDEQQVSFLARAFDLKLHEEPVLIGLADIDREASLSIGQNRAEMTLDDETVEILALYMAEGVSTAMPLVWKPNLRTKRVVVLDGNHRLEAALGRRAEAEVPCILVTGESQLAQRFAIVANTQHGRSTRSPEYVALSMRLLREAEVPVAEIALMFGATEAKVRMLTRRDAQAERIRKLVPEYRAKVPAHTLDHLGHLEDAHVVILGEPFILAAKTVQEEAVRRLRDAPSAERDAIAHEILGELREIERARRRSKATTSRPSSQLQSALSRLATVADPTRAYFQSTDQAKAIMRSNLATVMPRLGILMATISGSTEVA